MPAHSDLQGAAILSAVFLCLLAAAEVWRRFGSPKPEWTRKLVHAAGGIVCLFFPWLIQSPWVVLIMALALSALFVSAGRLGFLKSLHGVARSSRGVEYYPLSIWLVFLIAGDRAWLYMSAVLVLAVGDAFAALIGSRYGVIRYEIEEDHKSLEGSLVFLVIAFLAIHVPMLLMTDLPRPVCVLSALLVATLVTGFEAISLRGADNLFVPLAVVVILAKITSKPLPEIVFQNLSLLAICLALALLVRRYPLFNAGASIAVILYAYGAWSLGSWHWALPVFGGLICYMAVWAGATAPRKAPRFKVKVVARALLAPFLLLIVANSAHRHDLLFGPYLGANAATLTFSLVFPLERLWDAGRWAIPVRALLLSLLGSAATLLPAWLAAPAVPLAAPLAVLAALLAGTCLLLPLESGVGSRSVRDWTAARFLLSLAVAGAVLALQWLQLIPDWIPL